MCFALENSLPAAAPRAARILISPERGVVALVFSVFAINRLHYRYPRYDTDANFASTLTLQISSKRSR